jgi:8-oxo-dGTP pyrophosphatase MutT (NUDIX family)
MTFHDTDDELADSASRAAVARLLHAHVAMDEREARDLERMRRCVETLAAPLSRHQMPAHFTASAVVLRPDLGAVALLHHRRLGLLLQPGGHVEAADGGDLLTAALREVREELGVEARAVSAAPLDVDIHPIPAARGEAAHEHLDVRFLLVAGDMRLEADAVETSGAGWYAWAELDALPLDPPLRRALAKARRG